MKKLLCLLLLPCFANAAITGLGSGVQLNRLPVINNKGSLLTWNGTTNALVALSVGSNGEVLQADSSEATGLTWVTLPGGGNILSDGSVAFSDQVEFQDGGDTVLFGANNSATSLTNATAKGARLYMPHYLSDTEEYVTLVFGYSDLNFSNVNIGGGTANGNAASAVNLFVASDYITTTGTAYVTLTAGLLDLSGTDLQLDNNEYVKFKDTGGTARNVLAIDSSNVVQAGSLTYPLSVNFETELTMTSNDGGEHEFNTSAYVTHDFVDSNVANPITDLLPADTFGRIAQRHTTVGGLEVTTVAVDASISPMAIKGAFGVADPTDTTAAVQIRTMKSDGAVGIADLAATETAFNVGNRDGSNIYFTVSADSNAGLGDTSPTEGKLTINEATSSEYAIHITAGKIRTADTTTSVGTCGTTPSILGSDVAGKVTVGSGVTTSCVVTFASAYVTNAPACTIAGDNTAVTYAATTTTAALTITSSADMASDVISYICVGL